MCTKQQRRCTVFIIHRDNVLKLPNNVHNRITSNERKQLLNFFGESGVDTGGPTHGFFTLVLKEIQNMLFEGREGFLIPVHNLS